MFSSSLDFSMLNELTRFEFFICSTRWKIQRLHEKTRLSVVFLLSLSRVFFPFRLLTFPTLRTVLSHDSIKPRRYLHSWLRQLFVGLETSLSMPKTFFPLCIFQIKTFCFSHKSLGKIRHYENLKTHPQRENIKRRWKWVETSKISRRDRKLFFMFNFCVKTT